MDFRTLATFLALFFTTSDADHATVPRVFSTSRPNSGIKPNYTEVSTFTTTTSVSRDGELTQQLAVSSLFVLTVEWTTTCGGHLVLHHAATAPPMPSSHVCYDGGQNVKNLSLNLCKNRKGCRDNLRWDKGRTGEKDGFYISDRGVELSSCETMTIHCAVETEDVLSEVQQQLRVYKTLMALLCCVLLLLLLLRFTRPTVRALQKRLSDKRQDRWIGPTQSHSVSYHRGKTAVKTNDKEQRHSYPALERLTVGDSREPSSNRNSDYNY